MNKKGWFVLLGIIAVVTIIKLGPINQQSIYSQVSKTYSGDNVVFRYNKFSYTAPKVIEQYALYDFNQMVDCYNKIGQDIGVESPNVNINMVVSMSDVSPRFYTNYGGGKDTTIYLTGPSSTLAGHYAFVDENMKACQGKYGDSLSLAHELVHAHQYVFPGPANLDEGFAEFMMSKYAAFDQLQCGPKTFAYYYPAEYKDLGYINFFSTINPEYSGELSSLTSDYEYPGGTSFEAKYGTSACIWEDIQTRYGFNAIRSIVQNALKIKYQSEETEEAYERRFLTEAMLPVTGTSFKNELITKYGFSESQFVPVPKITTPVPVESTPELTLTDNPDPFTNTICPTPSTYTCPNGYIVARVKPTCEFLPCPTTTPATTPTTTGDTTPDKTLLTISAVAGFIIIYLLFIR